MHLFVAQLNNGLWIVKSNIDLWIMKAFNFEVIYLGLELSEFLLGLKTKKIGNVSFLDFFFGLLRHLLLFT